MKHVEKGLPPEHWPEAGGAAAVTARLRNQLLGSVLPTVTSLAAAKGLPDVCGVVSSVLVVVESPMLVVVEEEALLICVATWY